MKPITLILCWFAALLAGCQPGGSAGPGNDTLPTDSLAEVDNQAFYDSLGQDLADNLARWPHHQDKYIRPIRDGMGFQSSFTYWGFLTPTLFRYWIAQAWSSAENVVSVRVACFTKDSLNTPRSILIDTVFECQFIRNISRFNDPGLQLPILCLDINADTVLDFLVLNNTTGGTFIQRSYALWLGNKNTGSYTFIPGFDTLLNPAYNPQTNQIVDRLFHSQLSNSITRYTTYEWVADSLVPILQISRDVYYMSRNENCKIPVEMLSQKYNRLTKSWDIVYQNIICTRIDDPIPPINFNAFCLGCDAALPLYKFEYNLLEQRN